MSTAGAAAPRSRADRLRAARDEAATRVTEGWRRVRSAWFAILQAASAAAIAYGISHTLLGHPYPIFAPIAAWIALGFSEDRQLRRILEISAGVAVGIGLAELLVSGIGSGAWQVGVVLALAALIGRFIDKGQLVARLAGSQAIVVVGFPSTAAGGGGLGRLTDAIIGGLAAFVIVAVTPSDPRRLPRRHAHTAILELAVVLRLAARGLREQVPQDLEEALLAGRSSQSALDAWKTSATDTRKNARVTPLGRRYQADLRALEDAAVMTDRAMRNARVLARRALTAIPTDATASVVELAGAIDQIADAVDELGEQLTGGGHEGRARALLTAAAERLDPYRIAQDDIRLQSLVLLARSLVVDLFEASGATAAEARTHLPSI
ncbi:FUSC family protein [Cellulomonas chengniuliangii]|uniref:FUSC family protein n=1 Tax=Cellulomonas chengniuliangii TaxID=2968084 RepID=UPI001D0E0FCC|nr:FUSC family protein [Cellulomonas chengniuliangii]MCC2316702.1 FUSC family protein [Cellulomonas chengniuliangii]